MERYILLDGREVNARTMPLLWTMESQIVPFDALYALANEDGSFKTLMPIIYRHVHASLCSIADAIEKRFGEIEIVFDDTLDTVLAAQPVPQEVTIKDSTLDDETATDSPGESSGKPRRSLRILSKDAPDSVHAHE